MHCPLLATCLLFSAALLLAACGPSEETPAADVDNTENARLVEGTWTGGLTPMNHPDMVTPLTYDVAYEEGDLTLNVGVSDGEAIPARDLALDGDTLRFVFDEPDAGIPLRCALGRQAGGRLEGRCADADGKWARFTMTPPSD